MWIDTHEVLPAGFQLLNSVILSLVVHSPGHLWLIQGVLPNHKIKINEFHFVYFRENMQYVSPLSQNPPNNSRLVDLQEDYKSDSH